MPQVKLTVVRGRTALKDIAISAGAAIGGGDAIELNIDATRLSKGEALLLVEALKARIVAAKWPMV